MGPSSRLLGECMKGVLVVVCLFLICAGTIVGLYFLTDFSRKPEPAPSADLEAAKQRIAQLDTQLKALEQSSLNAPKAGTSTDAAYLQGLKQHEALLDDIRSELRFANEQATATRAALTEARETEKRTREAATTFLAVFAIIAGLLAGQGYLTIEGWRDEGKAAIDAVKTWKTALETDIQRLLDKVESGVEQVEGASKEINLIRETKESLETKLPEFLDKACAEVLQSEGKDPGATIRQGDLVLIDEIDHMTYLANPAIRFQKDRTPKDATEYLQSLLLVGRGHFARGKYDETVSRVYEFFRVLKENPATKVEECDLGRAYAYRAFARFQLLRARQAAPSWMRKKSQDGAQELWRDALDDAEKAKAGDPAHSLFVQALLYSREYVPDWEITEPGGVDRYLKGQRMAIGFYQEMLQKKLPFWPVPINLVCCLKRVADTTGTAPDYLDLQQKLQSFPDEKELEANLKPGAGVEVQSRFLWQNLMGDPDLFGKVTKIDAAAYKQFWTDLLDQKVTLRNWRADLDEIRILKPSAKSWQIQLSKAAGA